MGIIDEAKLADRHIGSRQELYEKQVAMLKTIFEHNAISEDEYRRSVDTLTKRMLGRTG